jgi:hypothetical protein
MADAKGQSGRGRGNQQQKRQRYRSDSEHVVRKRLPPRLPRRNNDIYITNKSNYQVCICMTPPVGEDLSILTMENFTTFYSLFTGSAVSV